MNGSILTLNAGSSSIKFALYDGSGERQSARGQVAAIGPEARLELSVGKEPRVVQAPHARDHAGALDTLINALGNALPGSVIDAVGHRIVHGGVQRTQPCRLSPDILGELSALTRLAPLHQPHNLAGVHAATAAFPQALQVGCFDTAFHHTMAASQTAFALPWRLHEAGLRRYGFHGLSYASIARQLRKARPALLQGRIVVAHLGAGASMCAMENGESRATTMGFSTLDGLPMATRCGALDAGLMLHLLDEEEMSISALGRLLYEQSGLKGLSELSGDMRVLEADGGPGARRAIEVFVIHCRRQIAALGADLGGLDGLVFTAGIGENAPGVRAAIVNGLGFLGFRLDDAANLAGAAHISAAASLPVLVLPCDEEGEIARAAALLRQSG